MPMALASLRRMSVLLQRSLQLIASPLRPGRHSRVYLAVFVIDIEKLLRAVTYREKMQYGVSPLAPEH